MTAISLFSGMGGDSLGIREAGFDVVAYSEKEPASHEMIFSSKLIPDTKGGSDITKIPDSEFEKYQDVDLVFAGEPQGFLYLCGHIKLI
jgi:DNA (cytosine-5)-methyltransferase 1